MAFRADEAARKGFEEAERYFLLGMKDTDPLRRAERRDALTKIIDECGPIVDGYPTWHPFMIHQSNRENYTLPCEEIGYDGLDHTIFMANGFITCPYGDGQKVVDSVNALPSHHAATISAELLDERFYNDSTTAILVRCEWSKPMARDGTIPLSVAMPLLLEKEVPCWRWSSVAETWNNMRPYFLGRPCGSRSSLFVNQETGQAMKNIWNALINTGMFGPIMA